MLNIQEMVDKTVDTRKNVKSMLESGHYDFDEHNLVKGLKPADKNAIWETLRAVPLREFLAKSGDDGIAGAAYLIPEKIYQIMFDSAVEADICADISIAMIPADQIPGTTLDVDIAVDDSYRPHKYSSGGAQPTETIKSTQATLDFSSSWGINFKIANDMIEDSQFDLIEMHLRNAGREMGEYATNLAVTVLIAGADGDGTLNGYPTGTTAASETKWCADTTMDVEKAIDANIQDGFVSDTLLVSHHTMLHSLMRTVGTTGTAESQPWIHDIIAGPAGGWPTKMFGMNVIYSECDIMVLYSATRYDQMRTVVFDKDYALLTGRKRWLRIEKYSDPIRDLVGATVTARQDSVTVYNDSICVILEST